MYQEFVRNKTSVFPFRLFMNNEESSALYRIQYNIRVPENVLEYDFYITYYKRLTSSQRSFTSLTTINANNPRGSFNFYFALKYETSSSDIWGLGGA